MPGFVKTPKDEARWEKAKKAASKSTSHGTDSFWKLSNYIYHKMGKSQEDIEKAEEFKKSLLGTSVPSATKMPKSKMMPDPFAKPSKFFKKEEFNGLKKTSIENLRTFLEKHRSKR